MVVMSKHVMQLHALRYTMLRMNENMLRLSTILVDCLWAETTPSPFAELQAEDGAVGVFTVQPDLHGFPQVRQPAPGMQTCFGHASAHMQNHGFASFGC